MNIESIEDVRAWIAEHDGRINAYWEAQHSRNHLVDRKLEEYQQRITAVEKRVIFWAGMAAAAGAMLGGGGSSVLKALTGGG